MKTLKITTSFLFSLILHPQPPLAPLHFSPPSFSPQQLSSSAPFFHFSSPSFSPSAAARRQPVTSSSAAALESSSSRTRCTYSRTSNKQIIFSYNRCRDKSKRISHIFRTFLECKEIQAVISIGCCYNLLSIKGSGNVGCPCGFPMSKAVVAYGVSLGKNSLDLACQSAERWRHLEEESGIQNFELHACRAAFQMLLERYYPEVVIKSPAIGRQGKALRRKQQKKNLDSLVSCGGVTDEESIVMSNSSHGPLLPGSTGREGSKSMDKYDLFERFSHSGLSRLGLECPRDLDLYHTWQETEPFSDLIGPYWSLRAALGPVVETLLLLDRLMFLQEQGSSLEAVMVPIFDPTLSPRNVAIIAKKC